MSKAAQLAALIGSGQAQGDKNLIINGNMACSQRGVTFTSPSAGAYTLDRFKYNENFGAACTITQSTDVPSSDGFLNSMKIDITTAATPASAEEFKIDYGVEGQDFSRAGFGTSGAQALTLSFWVKSNVTGVYRVNFFNLNGTGNKIVGGTYTINTASTWEKKTIAIPADTAQATYLTNAGGFRIEFYLASGPDRTSGSLPTDWIAYDATRRAAGHAVNLASSVSNEWYITGIQLEVGDVATPFEHESFAETLQKCQRYYFDTASTVNGKSSPTINGGFIFKAFNGNEAAGYNAFPVTMRAVPTITCNDNAGTQGKMHRYAHSDVGSNITFSNISCSGITACSESGTFSTASGGLNIFGGRIRASAEL